MEELLYMSHLNVLRVWCIVGVLLSPMPQGSGTAEHHSPRKVPEAPERCSSAPTKCVGGTFNPNPLHILCELLAY